MAKLGDTRYIISRKKCNKLNWPFGRSPYLSLENKILSSSRFGHSCLELWACTRKTRIRVLQRCQRTLKVTIRIGSIILQDKKSSHPNHEMQNQSSVETPIFKYLRHNQKAMHTPSSHSFSLRLFCLYSIFLFFLHFNHQFCFIK